MGMCVPGKSYGLALSAHQRRAFFSGQRSNIMICLARLAPRWGFNLAAKKEKRLCWHAQ